MLIDVRQIMNLETGDRVEDLHVQITEESKEFLLEESGRLGIVMGLYLDKLLTAIRLESERRSKKESRKR